MKHTIDIDIDSDSLDALMVKELTWHYENFGDGQGIPFVSHDETEEQRYVRKMRKALKRIIKFYGGKVE